MSQADSQLSGQLPTIDRSNLQAFNTKNGAVVASREDSEDDDEIRSAQTPTTHPKYGNMKVCYDGSFLVSLGPDYLCFLPAFLCFSFVSYLVVIMVHSSADSLVFKLITDFICIGECVSYLLVAISDPGVVTVPADGLPQSQRRSCGKCQMVVPRSARHCRDCNVCIMQYDHHCPWTSKCIGGNNLIRFYTFLGWTPFYMIFITVAFVVCMSNNLVNIKQKLPQ